MVYAAEETVSLAGRLNHTYKYVYKQEKFSLIFPLVPFLTQPSPVSRTGGHDRRSTTAAASLDLRSLLIACVVITHPERLTCIHTHFFFHSKLNFISVFLIYPVCVK